MVTPFSSHFFSTPVVGVVFFRLDFQAGFGQVLLQQIRRDAKLTERKILRLAKQHQRFTDLWEGWKWRLARNPLQDAVAISGKPNWWIIKTIDWTGAGIPNVLILYRVTPDEVYIHLIVEA